LFNSKNAGLQVTCQCCFSDTLFKMKSLMSAWPSKMRKVRVDYVILAFISL